MVTFEIADVVLHCETKPDLFSPKGLDTGSRLLLEYIFRHPEYTQKRHSELVSESQLSKNGILKGRSAELSLQDDESKVKILDWGCGWGAIGLTLAKIKPSMQITAIDSDIAAVSTTNKNAQTNQLKNVYVIASHGFDEIQKSKFDLIVSNPPTHRGREVVDNMIADSIEQLSSNGKLVIVVEARLKPWVARQIKTVFGEYKIAKRGPKHVVLIGTKS